LQFQQGTNIFYFYVRLEDDGVRFGLSHDSFKHAKETATSAEAELFVGSLDISASEESSTSIILVVSPIC
jgi:hypothetical protein